MAKPVANVVGGGSGIGSDTAKTLVNRGVDIAILSSSGKGQSLANELGGPGFTVTSPGRTSVSMVV